jgi:hypothetical protein
VTDDTEDDLAARGLGITLAKLRALKAAMAPLTGEAGIVSGLALYRQPLQDPAGQTQEWIAEVGGMLSGSDDLVVSFRFECLVRCNRLRYGVGSAPDYFSVVSRRALWLRSNIPCPQDPEDLVGRASYDLFNPVRARVMEVVLPALISGSLLLLDREPRR